MAKAKANTTTPPYTRATDLIGQVPTGHLGKDGKILPAKIGENEIAIPFTTGGGLLAIAQEKLRRLLPDLTSALETVRELPVAGKEKEAALGDRLNAATWDACCELDRNIRGLLATLRADFHYRDEKEKREQGYLRPELVKVVHRLWVYGLEIQDWCRQQNLNSPKSQALSGLSAHWLSQLAQCKAVIERFLADPLPNNHSKLIAVGIDPQDVYGGADGSRKDPDQRLQIDAAAHIVTFDNIFHDVNHPAAFALFKAIVEAEGRQVDVDDLHKLPGCKGKISRILHDHLPNELRSLLKSKRGKGSCYWLKFPEKA